MTVNINNTDGEFKTGPASDLGGSQADHAKAVDNDRGSRIVEVVRKTARKGLSSTARLVALAGPLELSSDAEIAEFFRISEGAVRKARRDLAELNLDGGAA